MPLWAAALLFLIFAAAGALSFRKARMGGGGVYFWGRVVFALLGLAAFLYAAATLLFVASID